MTGKYDLLEKYLRSLPAGQDQVTLSFENIEQISHDRLPPEAHEIVPGGGTKSKARRSNPFPGWMQAGWWTRSISRRSGSVLYGNKQKRGVVHK